MFAVKWVAQNTVENVYDGFSRGADVVVGNATFYGKTLYESFFRPSPKKAEDIILSYREETDDLVKRQQLRKALQERHKETEIDKREYEAIYKLIEEKIKELKLEISGLEQGHFLMFRKNLLTLREAEKTALEKLLGGESLYQLSVLAKFQLENLWSINKEVSTKVSPIIDFMQTIIDMGAKSIDRNVDMNIR